MSSVVEQLEPKTVWSLFAGIAAVPRPSKHEEKIRAHLRDLVTKQGLHFAEDAAGNLVIQVPASPGRENTPTTVLQAHVDMVCEKNSNVEHDFDTQGIEMTLDKDAQGDEIVRAKGTTLGADNGIGVAMALACAFDKDVVHGPLEILLTTDEEAGMTGAKALTPDSFTGRTLFNLDSEEDDAIYIGCAGGCDTNLTWELPLEDATNTTTFRVDISGLRGGHSGGDIHENRANAIKVLARLLLEANVEGLRLVGTSGGSKRNAIPREAWAVVCGPADGEKAISNVAKPLMAAVADESGDRDVSIRVVTTDAASQAASPADTRRLLEAIASLPNGVLGMSPAVPGLVQTSNNVSTLVATQGGTNSSLRIEIGTLSRSSSAYWNDVTLQQIESVGRLAGAEVVRANEYPGWEPNLDSSALATVRRSYEQLFGATPKIAAIHAGLECGIIGERVSGVDMVSFGPRIEGAHSPDERVYPASVAKSWSLLRTVLEAGSA